MPCPLDDDSEEELEGEALRTEIERREMESRKAWEPSPTAD